MFNVVKEKEKKTKMKTKNEKIKLLDEIIAILKTQKTIYDFPFICTIYNDVSSKFGFGTMKDDFPELWMMIKTTGQSFDPGFTDGNAWSPSGVYKQMIKDGTYKKWLSSTENYVNFKIEKLKEFKKTFEN